jgi:hypothetical protein
VSQRKRIANCKSASGAAQSLTCIEYRITDARSMRWSPKRLGWLALEQSWQRERDAALLEMKRKGWT